MALITVDLPEWTLHRVEVTAREEGFELPHYVNRALLNQVTQDNVARAAQALREPPPTRGEPGE